MTDPTILDSSTGTTATTTGEYLSIGTFLQGRKYQIIRFIDKGGFGCTYEAINTTIKTHIAIKEFFPKALCGRNVDNQSINVVSQGNQEIVARLRKKFLDEARVLYNMSHPGVVRVLDVFEENGTAYFVMDYIVGRTLANMVEKEGLMPENVALGYIRQIADAMKYVHSKNLLHLDIKPQNIMVDKNGKAILIDFGASKHYDPNTGKNTTTIYPIHTPGYAPLEQISGSISNFSATTDIYALGATMYFLLTGKQPPLANKVLEEGLPSMPGRISGYVQNSIMTAMSPKRKDRYQNIKEFLESLNPKKTIHEPKNSTNITKYIVLIVLISFTASFFIGRYFASSSESEEHSTEEATEVVEETVDSIGIGNGYYMDIPVSFRQGGTDSKGLRIYLTGPTELRVGSFAGKNKYDLEREHDYFVNQVCYGEPVYDTYKSGKRSFVQSGYRSSDNKIYYVKCNNT